MRFTDSLVALDIRLLHWSELQRQRGIVLQLARHISRSGDGYVQVACVAGFCLSSDPHMRAFALWLAALFCVERALYWVLKNTLRRRRPPALLPSFKAVITASDQFSFPSGHTSAAFLLVIALAQYNMVIALACLPWALCVGASRVILGVHFPSDILAGVTLASLVVYFGVTLAQYFPAFDFLI